MPECSCLGIKYATKKVCFLIGFFYFIFFAGYSQNQAVADSLEAIYLSGNYNDNDKLKMLFEIESNQADTEKSLAYSLKLIEAAKVLDSVKYIIIGYLGKGTALRLKGDLSKALESYFEAARIASEEEEGSSLGQANFAIADVYSIMGNHDNAIKYYQNAIKILQKEKDSINLATALTNAGDDYFNNGKLDSALIYFEDSDKIFRKINYPIGTAYNKGNIGMVYAEQGEDDRAEVNINEAITILEELQDYYPISVFLTYMSDIYLRKNNWSRAISYAQRSLDLAQRYGLKEQISESNLKLSELYDHVGNYKKSNSYYKNHIAYRDSVTNLREMEQMADVRTNFEVAQKQSEVDLLEKESEIQLLKDKRQKTVIYVSIIVLILVFFLAMGLYRRNIFIKKTKNIIEEEKNRSDKLLLNILPEETAIELKQRGKVQAKKFESVSIMFTDFKGFTHYADNLAPEKLVETVDYYFSKFDEIIEKYGLEKIKTIGDSYMCAGGLPYPSQDHATKTVLAALEMIEFVNLAKTLNPENRIRFDVRIGINTGPVVAGVVGTKKFAYDIWGDAVNIASRMESNSQPGKINVTENTFTLIKDSFDCEMRGEIEVKNKGMMNMYFVSKIED
ncbi:adenylate/guanylate cyclase domain-containing protein [uncultured Eudoraea sp.]|uniref:adenylate/guanylate cyclase domain-containing protein n=1 Tax=uncultured Eudoraea sp. TaxID=1035614 RepID=UPI002637E742|nr:adenylate/guanylate cyclase domain-containing protein [uncultured Eudoraea sp.]